MTKDISTDRDGYILRQLARFDIGVFSW